MTFFLLEYSYLNFTSIREKNILKKVAGNNACLNEIGPKTSSILRRCHIPLISWYMTYLNIEQVNQEEIDISFLEFREIANKTTLVLAGRLTGNKLSVDIQAISAGSSVMQDGFQTIFLIIKVLMILTIFQAQIHMYKT